MAAVQEAYGKLPLSFEANRGQTDSSVKFLSRGPGYSLFLTPTEAVLALRGRERVIRLRLEGANPNAQITGLEKFPGIVNYFIGQDRKKWRTNVPTYARVKQKDVYPGIDIAYYGNQRQLEYDLVVAPGADPDRIHLGFEGAEDVRLDGEGNLVIAVSGGEVHLLKPHVYQESKGQKQMIAARYILHTSSVPSPPEGEGQGEGGQAIASFRAGIQVAGYDSRQPLIIDPVLFYSTYLGGSGEDFGLSIAVDAAGNAYVTGGTSSTNFPTTPGAFQTTFGGGGGGSDDVFITKLNPTGSGLIYSTYLGGSGDDEGGSIAVDTAGNAYVTGGARSTNFPTTPGAFQTTCSSSGDGFVAKLNATGSALVYSTCGIGGSIAVDAAGNAYVTGFTNSTDFPTTPGAFQPAFAGGSFDAFVTKLNPFGTDLVYSTFLGGSGEDGGIGIAVDDAGNAYVTGRTNSINFPTTPGAFQPAFAGGSFDAFVTKLNPLGTDLFYSTYLGGSGDDFGGKIAVDAAGNAYVTAGTGSTDFPTTLGAFQTTFGGGDDVFITKLNPTGSGLIYSTYLGGSGGDRSSGIAVDTAGNAYVTGTTGSTNLPTTLGAFQTALAGGGDAFVTKLNSTGSGLIYSTYLGGSGFDESFEIALDTLPNPNAYVTGCTDSTNFPTTPGAFQTTFGGGGECEGDAFVAKLSSLIQPFAQLKASVEIEDERDEREFAVKGTFTLGAGSDGIHPLTEDVTLEVGAFAATIPAGSFRRHGDDTYKFDGVAGGARLEVKIKDRGGDRFEFKAEGKGAQVGPARTVTVRLAVGDDDGSVLARDKVDDD